MAKYLIPRSDSVSVKVIEPSDFEEFFSNDIVRDYVVSGLTLSAGSGLAVNIASGKARLKGLFCNNTSSASKGSLTASDVNYIYITLARDGNSEAESWDFSSNVSGTTPADSLFIGTATCDGSGVTAVSDADVLKDIEYNNKEVEIYGDGSDGDVTLSANTTTLAVPKQYNNLTLNASKILTTENDHQKSLIIRVAGTLTVSGTITMTGKGALSAPSAAGGSGGGSPNSSGEDGTYGAPGTAPFGITSKGGAGGNGGDGGGTGSAPIQGGSGRSGGAAFDGQPLMYASTSTMGRGNDGEGQAYSQRIDDNRINSMWTVLNSLPLCYGGGGGCGGAGGGGGKGSYSGSGGTGGNGGSGGDGGGTIILIAKTIVINSGGIIESKGNAGGGGTGGASGSGSGTYYSGGSGGGCGGGGGGFICLIYDSLTNNGTITVDGGAGGAAGSGGASNGTAGSVGQAGVIKQYQRTNK